MAIGRSLIKAPEPPEAQSRSPPPAEEDDPEQIMDQTSVTDPAIAAASLSLADEIVLIIDQSRDINAKINELKSDDEFVDQFCHEVVKKKAEIQPSKKLSEQDKDNIVSTIKDHWDILISPILENYRDIAQERSKNPKYTVARARRDAINEILRLCKSKGTHYEVLGLPNAAPIQSVNYAFKKKALLVHPDRNHDQDARSCFQALESAMEVLRDPGSKADYDKTIAGRAPTRTDDIFGEDFYQAAWDSESEEEDNGAKSKPSKPPTASKEIKAAHQNLTLAIHKFFENPKAKAKAESKFSHFNKLLAIENERRGLEPELYNIDVEVLNIFYQDRTKILTAAEQGSQVEALANEVQQLHKGFVKTCLMDQHQWPTEWADILIKTLPEKLQRFSDQKPSEEAGTSPADENSATIDVPMTDQGHKDVAEYFDFQPETVPSQDGFTGSGDRIIGCLPLRKHFKLLDNVVMVSCQYFIEVNKANPLHLAQTEDIGIAATKYLNWGHHEDKGRSQARCSHLKVSQYKGIKGVAYNSNSKSTWVWVEGWSEPGSTKIVDDIITRSALRGWLGKKRADKAIEDFYIRIEQEPEWVREEQTFSQNRYILRYPLPSRFGRAGSPKQIGWNSNSNRLSPMGLPHEERGLLAAAETNNQLEVRTKVLEDKLDELVEMVQTMLRR